MMLTIAVAAIAVCAAAVTVYAVRLLRSLAGLTVQAQVALRRMQREAEALSGQSARLLTETEELVRGTKRLTEEVNAKLEATNALFDSVRQAGAAVREVASSVRRTSSAVASVLSDRAIPAIEDHREQMRELAEWARLSGDIVRKWKAGLHAGTKNEKEMSGNGG